MAGASLHFKLGLWTHPYAPSPITTDVIFIYIVNKDYIYSGVITVVTNLCSESFVILESNSIVSPPSITNLTVG